MSLFSSWNFRFWFSFGWNRCGDSPERKWDSKSKISFGDMLYRVRNSRPNIFSYTSHTIIKSVFRLQLQNFYVFAKSYILQGRYFKCRIREKHSVVKDFVMTILSSKNRDGEERRSIFEQNFVTSLMNDRLCILSSNLGSVHKCLHGLMGRLLGTLWRQFKNDDKVVKNWVTSFMNDQLQPLTW